MNKRYLRYSPSIGRFIPSARPLDLSLRHQTLLSVPTSDLAKTVPEIESNHEHKEGGIDQPILIGETTKTISTPAPIPSTSPATAKDTDRYYLGIELPKKPSPPEEGECCMSGCAHCIYDIYLEDLSSFHLDLSETRSKILKSLKQLPLERRAEVEKNWPEDALGDLDNCLEGEGGNTKGDAATAKAMAEKELEKARQDLDPATRAFLEMEAKMKKKQQQSTAPGTKATTT
ncbi:hypothetical protein JCM3765_005341 [Sporobolomyces pararoseus]